MPPLDLEKSDMPDPSLKILLAEDNKVNQMLTLKQLKKWGYEADVVSDGEAVLEALRQKSYDVILMDVQMIPMDGLTASLRIQQIYPPEKRPYIIALTAHDLDADRQRCAEAGMQDYLIKPLREANLVNALQQAANQISGPIATSEPNLESSLEAVNALPVLDQSILEGIRQLAGNPQSGTELLKMLANQYLEDIPGYLMAIAAAFTAEDDSELAKTTHALRSSTANLGGAQLAQLCKIIENLGRSQQLQAARPYQQPLNDLATAFQNALRLELLSDP